MKKIAVVLVVFAFCACGLFRKKSEATDPLLHQRLTEFVKLTNEMAFEKRLDYVYPRLFTLIPRNQLLNNINETIKEANGISKIDSLKVDSLYPVFKIDNGSYAKIACSVTMLFNNDNVNDTTETTSSSQIKNEIKHTIGSTRYPAPQATLLRTLAAQKFGEENVVFDKATGILKVRMRVDMVGIKDDYAKEWSFINLKEEDSITNKLFSKKILDKLATYK